MGDARYAAPVGCLRSSSGEPAGRLTNRQTQGILASVGPLQVNPETGFLESPNRRAFNSETKLKVLSVIKTAAEAQQWPKITEICKAFDVGSQTFYDHLESDSAFREAYEEAMAPVEDQLASNLYKQGLAANGITANIFLLKTRWKKRWGENNSNIYVDIGTVKGLLGHSSTVFDADIVEKPSDIKQSSSDTKQLPQLPASKDRPNDL